LKDGKIPFSSFGKTNVDSLKQALPKETNLAKRVGLPLRIGSFL
jgi:hypothetical protein